MPKPPKRPKYDPRINAAGPMFKASNEIIYAEPRTRKKCSASPLDFLDTVVLPYMYRYTNSDHTSYIILSNAAICCLILVIIPWIPDSNHTPIYDRIFNKITAFICITACTIATLILRLTFRTIPENTQADMIVENDKTEALKLASWAGYFEIPEDDATGTYTDDFDQAQANIESANPYVKVISIQPQPRRCEFYCNSTASLWRLITAKFSPAKQTTPKTDPNAHLGHCNMA